MRISKVESSGLKLFLLDKEKMFVIIKHCVWVFIIMLTLGGCTHHYIPNPSTFNLMQ